MGFLRELIAYVIDANNQPVKTLGTFYLSVLQGNSDMSKRNLNSLSDLNGYVDDPALIGGGITASSGHNDNYYYTPISNFAPFVTKLLLTDSDAGYKIKISNSSGYYAISNSTIPAYPSISGAWNLYDKQNNLIQDNVYIFPSYPYSEGIVCVIAQNINNGVISGTIRTLGVTYSDQHIKGRITTTTTTLSSAIITWVNNLLFPAVPSDPYSGGGTSGSGGGSGSFDDTTDSVNIPSYDPTESYNRGYANHGFAKVYLPTAAQLLSLHQYLWSSSLDTTMKKMYASPIDCIISLNMIPLDLSSILGDPVQQENIIIGNVDTEIGNVNVPFTQFITLDCGSISINEFFGSYLDYSPYTKLSIYLPYIGMKELDIDDFMNGEISVKYYIDIVSGDCVAYIIQSDLSSNDVRPALAGGAGVLYQFNGNVAFNVPISAQNFSQIYAASAGAMIGGAGMLASALSGGMSAPMALTGIAATGVNVATSKPTISRGGSIPSTAGYLGVQKPYLILTRPRQCLPDDQNSFVGYPAYITVIIDDIDGYNEFEIVHLENVPATDTEKDEIEKLLKSGVIL